MNSRKHFGGGHVYPQDQEFQSSNSCLPGNGNETRALDMQMFKGLQPVVVDRFGNSLAETDRQLGYFSSQLTEGVPNDWSYNPIPQVGHIGYAQAIGNGSALNPFYQAKPAGYSQAIRSGSTCRNGCMENILSPDITAQSESPNITLGKSYGAPNGHLLPSLQSFVDNCGQSVPISSLLDMLSQPLDSTIFSNTNNFNKMQQPARMEMASFPAKVKQGNHTNESGRSTSAFHELNQHDYNLNHSPRNNNTCDADSIANLPVTLDKSIEVENFQLSTMTGSTIEQNHIKSTENEAIQHSYDGVLQNVESSTAASTLSRITIDLTKISDQGIDLNKTPQQKPAKRRKHRPKVVIEGKPERRTGTTTKNSTTSNEKSSGKRKYVRRKVMTELDQKPGARKKIPDSNSGRARRSCKRNLDFDLDKSDGGNPENIVCQHGLQQTNRSFELNSISEDTGSCSRFNSVGQMEPKTKISLQNGFEEANEQEIAHTSLTPSTSCNEYKWNENTFLQNQQKVSSILDIDKSLHTGNLSFTNRHGEIGKNDPGQHRYTLTHHQPDLEGKGQTLFQESTQGGLIKSRNLLPYTAPKNVIQFPINPSKARGLGYYHTAEQPYPIATNTIWEAECHRHSCSTVSEDGQKKRKVENRILMKMPVPHSSLVQFENDTIHSRIDKACSPTSQTIQSVLKSYSGSNYPQTLNTGVNNYSDIDSLYPQLPAGSSFSRHHNSSPPESYLERVGEAKKLAQVNSSTPQIVDKCKLTPQTPAKTTRAVKRQTSKRRYVKRSAKSKKAATTPFTSNVLDANGALQEQESPSDHVHSFQKTRGDEAHTYPYIDEVIKLLNSLNIRAISDQNQKALIPYGGSGAIIPLDTKKKRLRPKVDLDTETIRVWNLLMGIEGGTGTDTMHKGSESWWESERKVFRGRTDSFIARMRLVQGDRHFSRWKGSVVDSVIGVFLTQNVSDHLSSSAFMTLAAAFPLNLRSSSRVSPQNSARMLVEEPETSVPDPNEPARHDKVSYRITETSRTESQSLDEEIISPQDSFDSSVIQGTGTIRSYSGSNSEAEDTTPQNAYHRIHESTSTEALLTGKATPFEDNFNRMTGSSLSDQRSSHRRTKRDNIEYEQQTALLHIGNSDNMPEHSPVMHVENSKLNTTDSGVQQGFNEESSSSWPSTISILGHTKEVPSSSSMIGQTGSLKSSTVKNQDLPISEEKIPRVHNALTEQQCTSTPEYKTANFQQCDINSQLESITGTKQINIAKVLVDGETSTIQHIHNVSNIYKDTFEVEKSNLTTEKQRKLDYIEEATVSKDQHRPSATASNGSNNSINKRKKGKAGGEIKPDEYWESLRKQVQGEGNSKEKSHDAMDSMDYEAIRHASVNHISGVIKERGMNNRLAERMKEFLNRLVQAHGSIDLEWLRDVSPDEAKDYLLNIWGIGLKSVECVRLLTLHHLAFPVDTNVGRIAVRLGWVPLQPLPESLQLHLLELYPILDTIQKYLWPRLCQLDQQTLYELHYHLITFGKVFCTKHKPNCNACPMRGECRHFASAFASARLALPGPKEKNIVSSCPPIASEGDKPLEINKVPQLTALSSSLTVTCSGKSKCLPIIEEPKTPEPEPREVLEYDIEDAFWEDPDEIPFFRLNMQEFTDNLQNYVQANMELQESDVSKALVALTPEAASIPAPKLKNVNRLRTEHQVYELPDLHPLLEGMDRREPDDPSPYLFAIWTPGETANTVQPPESICDSQETGKLCNEKTCFTCNNIRESDSQTVRGTLLIPCRTAMRGRFPLNGTYFQVNEVFADDNSSKNPIAVPRQWLWNLPRRTVYFGTSVTSIFRGLTTEQIQLNFWRGFVCVRGFDQETRAPRPLVARLHCSLARLAKEKMEKAKDEKH